MKNQIKNIWIVSYGMIHDGYSVIGVFSSEKKAKEHAAKQIIDRFFRVFVEKWEIDTTRDPYE